MDAEFLARCFYADIDCFLEVLADQLDVIVESSLRWEEKLKRDPW